MSMRMILAPELVLSDQEFRRNWGILIDDGRITAVGPTDRLRQEYPGAEIHDEPGMLALPGTVNAHSHSFQSLMRGLADDKPFMEWRRVLYEFMPQLDEEAVYTAALFAFAEMLRSGITTVCDFFYLHHGGNAHDLAAIQAARDVGIRLVFARTMMDWPVAPAAFRETVEQAVANSRALAARVQGDPLVTVIPAPHSPHGASGEMIRAGAKLAAEWGTPWHIHVAEAPYEGEETRRRYGCGPLAWIASLGSLDERIRIVHGVWLEEEEITALGRVGGGLIHCPGSNLFLGDGFAPIPKYLRAGVTVALGCDSGAANNRLCLFDEMRLAATLQKGLAQDGGVLTAQEVFRMGTANGEQATGLPLGQLAPGYFADIVLVRLDDLSLQPPHNLVRNLVYSLNHRSIETVYVHGKVVVRGGRLVQIDEADLASKVATLTEGWTVRTHRLFAGEPLREV